ncbi:transcriptional regulator : Transcriptional regulator OS=Cupriavidus sp. SK-3 GN=CF70_030855 PE=4 SV=1: MarR [Gemmata massiliana]|uniref:HTH marR-type domain-containing protein n=2 Tax=Gemmata massiliana TaxID=1210884 RepID=A0A6P2D2A4_9BACT|nr:transcriptional regulator : Transcriptional regulator OS=Cupriavidus sp. SK-3 GN=CF70_030855 PE=4 SV=1: MarR [Gemmata massiliana]
MLSREGTRNYLDVKKSNMDTTDAQRPTGSPDLGARAERDVVDRLLVQWRAARPELDPSPLGIVGRVIVLAQHLERSVEASLEKHKLTLGQFDILATLRRRSKKGGLTPTQLLESVVLSSGGMTARLDALAEAGYIFRKPNPTDRRMVVIELTAKGRRAIDTATKTRFNEAKESLPNLSESEMTLLTNLLRRWLAEVAG